MAVTADGKLCAGPCGRRLPLEAFGLDRGKRDGRAARCSRCAKVRAAELRAAKVKVDGDAGPIGYVGDHPWVISYGCSVSDALVKVAVTERPPSNAAPGSIPRCPRCGNAHTFSVIARKRRPAEAVDLERESVAR